MISKARSRIWFLKRLKLLGAPIHMLIDVFKLYVRSRLEMAVPLWAGALTKKNIQDIELVQVNCLQIIIGDRSHSYKQSLKILGLDTLAKRRDKLCLKFAKKSVKNPRFSHWFPLRQAAETRSHKKYVEPKANTKRFLTSSIPHLIRLMNSK